MIIEKMTISIIKFTEYEVRVYQVKSKYIAHNLLCSDTNGQWNPLIRAK